MRTLTSFTLLIALFTLTTPVRAGHFKAIHDWASNPAARGSFRTEWTLKDDSNGAHVFGIAPKDMGNKSTWKVDTISGGAAGVGAYQIFTSRVPSHWTLSTMLRAVEIDAPGGQAVRIGGDGRIYTLLFSTSDDGDPIVSLEGSPFSMEIEGGAGAYHRYNLRILTNQSDVRLSRFSVDGELVFTGYEGVAGEFSDGLGPRIAWGDIDPSADVNGRAHWGIVYWFDATPEPSAMILLLTGAFGFLGLCPRRVGARRAGCDQDME